jgi:hypothetical protein
VTVAWGAIYTLLAGACVLEDEMSAVIGRRLASGCNSQARSGRMSGAGRASSNCAVINLRIESHCWS